MRRREKRRFYEDRIEDAICFSFNGMSRRRPLIRGEETVDLWGGDGGYWLPSPRFETLPCLVSRVRGSGNLIRKVCGVFGDVNSGICAEVREICS